MGTEYHNSLHIFFFPYFGHGHIKPTVDMAKLFASKGVKATIITTPSNETLISKFIQKSKISGHNIHIQTIEFTSPKTCLPNGSEIIDSIPSPESFFSFLKATESLQEPLEKLLVEQNPDCVVADMFFPWVTDSASKFGIPRIVFHGTSFFSLCATYCIKRFEPFKNVSSDFEPFVITDLPGNVKMTKSFLQPFEISKGSTEGLGKFFREIHESEMKSFGVVVNSFYELEKDYADYYRKGIGRKAWHIGPLCICNKSTEEKEGSIYEHECLKWLDMKKPNSVVYICFGSSTKVLDSQLKEIAVGLEASGKNFIWVVRKKKEEGEEWLPKGFEKRMEGKGLIVRGWAPQVLILEHEAVGAFVTHCGWNSILEGVCAGMPFVTWPVAAEQFYNEIWVTQVLKIGVPVGVTKWVESFGESIEWDLVEKAVKRILEGEEAQEIRNRVKLLSELAKKAVEEGGSSYSDLNVLIQDLSLLRN
ncbi:scopoletin glucosyltransferase-like [Cicer arietinum]|uniref:Scopoletin glucosyltransferase-like n=1 Tax=Cicer arietinum TaxID=3827 RepID=A0A1S2YJ23_CICAR|nr:scopoletin glucosyltransferase-like [Cicer arietinum]